MERPQRNPEKNFLLKLLEDMSEVFWVYTTIPFAQGRTEARRDLKEGKLILKTFGPPAKWRALYAELLRDHNITLEPVADTLLPAKQRERIRGYNAVVKEEIRLKHGKDFLDMMVDRAKEALLKEEQNKARR